MKKIFLAILLVCGVSTGALAKKVVFLSCGPFVLAIEKNTTNVLGSNFHEALGASGNDFYYVIDFKKERTGLNGLPIDELTESKLLINRISLQYEDNASDGAGDFYVVSRGQCAIGRQF